MNKDMNSMIQNGKNLTHPESGTALEGGAEAASVVETKVG